jgi:hypothetical protein
LNPHARAAPFAERRRAARHRAGPPQAGPIWHPCRGHARLGSPQKCEMAGTSPAMTSGWFSLNSPRSRGAKITDPKRGSSCARGQDSAVGIGDGAGLSRRQHATCNIPVQQPLPLGLRRPAPFHGCVNAQCPTETSGVAVSLYSAPKVVNTLSFRSTSAPVVLSMMT